MHTAVYTAKVPAKVVASASGSQVNAMVKLATHFTAKQTETPGALMCSGKISAVMI